MGARNFLIVSAPPLGCIPSTITLAGGGSKTRNCIDKYNQACELFNTKLSSAIDSLNNQLPKTRIVYVDIYFSLLELIQNPSNYGNYNIMIQVCLNRLTSVPTRKTSF